MYNEELAKYLSDNDKNLLFRFAFLGKDDVFLGKLAELACIAEDENWTSSSSTKEYNILSNYLQHTFERAFELGTEYVLVKEDETYCCFNTGLLTSHGEDIICMFNKFESSDTYSWHLMGFRKKSDWDFLSNFSKTPKVPHYFNNPADSYFDPNREIIKNFDHILDDNFTRFDEELQNKGKHYIKSLLNDAIDLTITKCKRNYRIAVPQYYKGKITYLLPVSIDDNLMAVAVEYINERYRVNTIFTLEMAYMNAGLLMKPEVDWISSVTKN